MSYFLWLKINCSLCRGDTLTAIAKRYNTTISRLAADNEIEDLDILLTGEKLVVHPRSARVRKFVMNTARTKASAKNVRALRAATTSGNDTPAFSHVGEHSPFPVGTLVRLLLLQSNWFGSNHRVQC